MNSSRSTRGTTRSRAYSNKLLTGFSQSLYPGPRFLEAGRQVFDVGRAHLVRIRKTRLVSHPLFGHEPHYPAQHFGREQGGKGRVSLRQLSREGEQHVIPGHRVRSLARSLEAISLRIGPVVMEVQGRSVIYQP